LIGPIFALPVLIESPTEQDIFGIDFVDVAYPSDFAVVHATYHQGLDHLLDLGAPVRLALLVVAPALLANQGQTAVVPLATLHCQHDGPQVLVGHVQLPGRVRAPACYSDVQ